MLYRRCLRLTKTLQEKKMSAAATSKPQQSTLFGWAHGWNVNLRNQPKPTVIVGTESNGLTSVSLQQPQMPPHQSTVVQHCQYTSNTMEVDETTVQHGPAWWNDVLGSFLEHMPSMMPSVRLVDAAPPAYHAKPPSIAGKRPRQVTMADLIAVPPQQPQAYTIKKTGTVPVIAKKRSSDTSDDDDDDEGAEDHESASNEEEEVQDNENAEEDSSPEDYDENDSFLADDDEEDEAVARQQVVANMDDDGLMVVADDNMFDDDVYDDEDDDDVDDDDIYE